MIPSEHILQALIFLEMIDLKHVICYVIHKLIIFLKL
jgi:hypothetical protein